MKWISFALALLFSSLAPAQAWNKHGYSVSAPSLPFPGNLIMHLSASDITGLTTGSQVSSWTAGTGGQIWTQGTSGNQPIYVTNRLDGKPSVQFNSSGTGTQSICLSTDPGSALANVLSYNASPAFNYTLVVIFRTLASRSNGALLAAHLNSDTYPPVAQGNELYLEANGTTLGATEGLHNGPTAGRLHIRP